MSDKRFEATVGQFCSECGTAFGPIDSANVIRCHLCSATFPLQGAASR